jgi:hypothetical protein
MEFCLVGQSALPRSRYDCSLKCDRLSTSKVSDSGVCRVGDGSVRPYDIALQVYRSGMDGKEWWINHDMHDIADLVSFRALWVYAVP